MVKASKMRYELLYKKQRSTNKIIFQSKINIWRDFKLLSLLYKKKKGPYRKPKWSNYYIQSFNRILSYNKFFFFFKRRSSFRYYYKNRMYSIKIFRYFYGFISTRKNFTKKIRRILNRHKLKYQNNLYFNLERRLDVLLCRSMFCKNIREAVNFIKNKKIMVNDIVITEPSYKTFLYDKIKIKDDFIRIQSKNRLIYFITKYTKDKIFRKYFNKTFLSFIKIQHLEICYDSMTIIMWRKPHVLYITYPHKMWSLHSIDPIRC